MLSERMTTVLALLHSETTPDHATGLGPAVAAAAADALGVDGISSGVGTGPQGTVLAWGREAVGAALEDFQFTIGQGPSLEAVAVGAPVLVRDLRDQAWRWPAFVPGAIDLGIHAVFAFPLRIGAISVGVLTAHRAAAGPLADRQLADALALADAITILLLHRAPDGRDGGRPAWSGPRPGGEQTATHRAEVHQATGIISAQLNVSLAEALARLRAHAYAHDRPVAAVAADVVARRLRLEDSN